MNSHQSTSSAATNRPGRVLIVDDDPTIRRLVQHFVKQEGCEGVESGDAEDALDRLSSVEPDVLILDWHLPGLHGIEALTQFSSRMPSLPIIMLTIENTAEAALEAMKLGAFEYLTKPVDATSLRVALRAALKVGQERRQRRDLEDTLGQIARQSAFPEILSCSPTMKPVFRLMERVIDRDLTVLIQGESGTGKELVAQAIHFHGKRGKAPFVALNCAALPENLVESELFGHEKGAFTGATAIRAGHIEMADTGTFFLDEVGEMPSAIQPKFLRCLQDHKVQRVGGNQTRQVDFRLIAATNSDLMQSVLDGNFREDLFYRLAVYPIQLPPLRDRSEDILLLLRHFLKQAGRKRVWIEPQAAELLEAYHWPGNIREIQNFAARLSVIVETDRITRDIVAEQLRTMGQQPMGVGMPTSFTFTTESQSESGSAFPADPFRPPFDDPPSAPPPAFPEPPRRPSPPFHAPRYSSTPAPGSPPTPYTPPPASGSAPPTSFSFTSRAPLSPPSTPPPHSSATPPPVAPATPPPPARADVVPMAEIERRAIVHALEAFSGNVTETARALGIGRATLYRYIRKHKIGDCPEPDSPDEDV